MLLQRHERVAQYLLDGSEKVLIRSSAVDTLTVLTLFAIGHSLCDWNAVKQDDKSGVPLQFPDSCILVI